MISHRLKTIASLVSKEDTVVDVGCDHGYLSIYLKENNICKNVIASDVNKNALNNAIENFQKRNLDIKTYLSDGFKNIDAFYDTAIIAGMGTNTILSILKDEKTPKKLILASNNELDKLRLNLNKLGYKIIKEKTVYDNKHYYVIMLCFKGKQKLNKKELLFGISNDHDYYNYLIKKNKEILSKNIPILKRIQLKYYNYLLKNLTEKK